MDDFRVYSPEDIIAANLREAVGRYDRFCEQETAHLRELAIELAGENGVVLCFGSLYSIGSIRDAMLAMK